MYSAPSVPGVLYWTHSFLCVIMASPVEMSRVFSLVATRRVPFKTIVYSSNSGVWPGSIHPGGLFIRAILRTSVWELTRPMNSSMTLGLLPAAFMMVGDFILVGIFFTSWIDTLP